VASFLDKARNFAYDYSGARNIMTGGRQLGKATTFKEGLAGVSNIAVGTLGFLPGIGAGSKLVGGAIQAGAKVFGKKAPTLVKNVSTRQPVKALTASPIKSAKDVVRKPDAKLIGLRNFGRETARGGLSTRGIASGVLVLKDPFGNPVKPVKPGNKKEPSLITIQPNNPDFNMNLPNYDTNYQTITPTKQPTVTKPTAPIVKTPVKPRLIDMVEPSKPKVPTQPASNVKGSTGISITPQAPRTTTQPTTTSTTTKPTITSTATKQPITQTTSTSTATQPPVNQGYQYQTETPKTQTQDNNWYPHYGTDGRFLGYYRYPQSATTQPPARDLAKEEEEAVSRYNREETERMYAQNLPNRLRLQAEEENYRQQQLNAARASDLQQQVSIIDARSTGVPPWMIAAKQRYEAGLGRSQALGAVREQDIRDLLSQRQMAARGRAAGMVGGRSTGILGSSLTGARRGYDLGMRNETLRRIEEQAALKERYDEYLSEAARQASLQQLEDAQERANIIQQIRSLGGSI
jgi:hypothetical protein